tara:strand:+ start:52 stop:390 length:339 start_codon:yes stop_codon:yes gene_type:complete
MKKLTILTGMCFALITTSAKADLFGASVKPAPSATIFGQKVTWPIPSLALGAKAGEGVDAKLSTKGVGFKLPFFAVNVPFPHVVVGVKDAKVSVGAHGVKKAGSTKTKKSKK